jgi:hypothetical protein
LESANRAVTTGFAPRTRLRGIPLSVKESHHEFRTSWRHEFGTL